MNGADGTVLDNKGYTPFALAMVEYENLRRADEINKLKLLLSGLLAVSEPMWMVTLVNKQDLWWDRRVQVRDYYSNGEYSELVDEFRAKMGAKAFQHEIVPASLQINNLVTPANELLANTVAGYDSNTHLSHLQTLYSKIDELVSAGKA